MTRNASTLATSALAGLLFGAGLLISDMTNPGRVMAFLQLDATWDATLAWVMIAALAVSLPGFAWAKHRSRPLVAGQFLPPPKGSIDRSLVAGAAIFGLGWGLAGYCPGPALVGAGLGVGNAIWFIVAMLGGAWLARFVQKGPA